MVTKGTTVNTDYTTHIQHQQRERALVRDVERRRVALERANVQTGTDRFALVTLLVRRARAAAVRRSAAA
jgi:hypothetical protein